MASDQEVLAAWRIGAIRSWSVAEAGTIHRTLLVDAEAGGYALRGYRHRLRSRVEDEHAIIAHAVTRGIPAPRPVPLPDGQTILEHGGSFYALFPRAIGLQRERAALTLVEIAAMGTFLSRVHHALYDFPAEQVQTRSLAVDQRLALSKVDRLIVLLRGLPAPAEHDHACQRRLDEQRAWIVRTTSMEAPSLGSLQTQVIHGDYQQTNLFFQHGHVSAIIDWDQAYVVPRAWELVRTMHLVWELAPGPCAAFLAAYRAGASLDDAELDLAAGAYGFMRDHDTWIYEALYLEGNQRVRQFIPPSGFVPFASRWATLRQALHRS